MPRKTPSPPALLQPGYAMFATGVVFVVATLSGLFMGKLWYQRKAATLMQDQAQLLYVQDARAGQLIPVEGQAATYTLELTDVSPRTLEFADRPERTMGSMSIAQFANEVWNAEENGFANELPTGILLTHNTETKHEDALVVKLADFQYSEAENTLQYTVVVVPDSFVEGFQASNDTDFSDFPTELELPVLFIDSTENWLRDWVSKQEN